MPGNSHGQESVLWLVDDVKTKLNNPLMIVRLDNGYLKGDILNELLKRQLQLVTIAENCCLWFKKHSP